MIRFQRCVSLIALWLACAAAAFPQASTSSLRGTVNDPNDLPIAGATVTLEDAEAKVTRTASTDESGEYRFLSLQPGTYTLSVTASGFGRYQQRGLQLLVNTPATANVQLKVGGTTESVTVSSEAPALNLVDASLGNSFDQTQVRQIPLEGRNVRQEHVIADRGKNARYESRTLT
jgi:Carboxypeptidase regulatory-like domain